MSSSATKISIHMDKEVKERLVEVLDNLGMNLSTGVNVWAKAVIRHGGFPFEIADPHVLARLENDRLSSRQKAAVRTFVKNVNTIEDEPLDEEFDAILNQKTSIVRQLDV